MNYINRNNFLLVIVLIGGGLLLYGGYQIYQLWTFTNSLTKVRWQLDEDHHVFYTVPPNWDVQATDNMRVIHPGPIHSDGKIYSFSQIRVVVLAVDEFSGTDFTGEFENVISRYFSSVKDFSITEPIQAETFDVYEAATAKISTVLFVKTDDTLSGLLERKEVEPQLLVENELTLVDYDGILLLIDTTWRAGEPEINPGHYRLLRAIRESIQLGDKQTHEKRPSKQHSRLIHE